MTDQNSIITLRGTLPSETYIETHDSAICVPLTDTGMIIFIVEPSLAYAEDALLLPGGEIEPGETPREAANRELQEEIGYRATKLDFLGEVRPWVRYLKGEVSLFLARDLIASKLHGDEIYEITTELVPIFDFERVIRMGRLRDATVISALYMARHFLQEEAAEREAELIDGD
ncbi:MAG: hypothetical protein OHK0046_08100 [Anaerolineae bacterium]